MRPSTPSYLVLFLTDDCNARCPYCFNPEMTHLKDPTRPKSLRALNLNEYVRIAENAYPLFQLVLSGGEPFLRSDIDDIVSAFYKNAGTRLFSMPTNGFLSARIMEKLASISARCPKAHINLIVSLDAAGKRHDQLRGVPGGFKKAFDLCRSLSDKETALPNVSLVVSTAVTQDNAHDVHSLDETLTRSLPPGRWLRNVQYDQRLNGAVSCDPAIRKAVRNAERAAKKRSGGFFKNALSALYVGRPNELIVRQLDENRMLYRCVAGRKLAVVLPDGRTYPCEPFAFEAHYASNSSLNLRDFDLDLMKLLETPEFVERQTYIKKGKCRACPWSCSAVASMTYDWRNWPLWFSGKRGG
jgi:radical SAM protein with 4Fe4S-binding SPASM domain